MAVAYRSSGTIVANGDAGVDMSSSLPAGLAVDDIMVFVGFDADNEHFDAAMPTGWTVIMSDNANNNLGITIAWKRRTGSESDWQFDTPTNAGQLVCGVIHAYSGALTSASPIGTITERTIAQTTTHSVTNNVAGNTGELLIGAIIIEDNVDVTEGSHTGTWTTRDNQTTTVGSDGRLMLGDTPDLTVFRVWRWTVGANEYGGGGSFWLKPADDTVQGASDINTSSTTSADLLIIIIANFS